MTTRPASLDHGDAWGAVVTAALLGTDRRDPPPPPAGPVAELLGDLALIAGDTTPDTQLLDHVVALTVAHRAASNPEDPVALLTPPDVDRRPTCPVVAVSMWHRIVADWPVLEDEWISLALRARVSVPGDLLVALLDRHRRDAERTTRIVAIAGPLAGWLAEHVPTVAGHLRRLRPGVAAEETAILPALPISAELEPLLGADAATFAGTLHSYLESGQLDATHLLVLTHLIARCRTAVLDETVDVLTPLAAGDTLAATIVGIAGCRRDLLAAFGS